MGCDFGSVGTKSLRRRMFSESSHIFVGSLTLGCSPSELYTQSVFFISRDLKPAGKEGSIVAQLHLLFASFYIRSQSQL